MLYTSYKKPTSVKSKSMQMQSLISRWKQLREMELSLTSPNLLKRSA